MPFSYFITYKELQSISASILNEALENEELSTKHRRSKMKQPWGSSLGPKLTRKRSTQNSKTKHIVFCFLFTSPGELDLVLRQVPGQVHPQLERK